MKILSDDDSEITNSTIFEPQATAKTSYLTNDHLGSPRILTDQIGAVISRRDFLPYGEEIFSPQRAQSLGYTADKIRRKFTTYKRDNETLLDFAEARIFYSTFGRFTTIDIAGPDLSDPQTLNKYQYCLNNPLRFIDKTGKYEEDVHRDLTELLAYAAGFTAQQSVQIANANQGVDDNPLTEPFRSPKVREQFHFTSEERRGELWSAFEKIAMKGGRDIEALNALGIFLHAQQDSFSHAGFGPFMGHLLSGHRPDKTDENPEKAERMARDTFDRLVAARNIMAKNDRTGQYYRPISYYGMKRLISRWVRESDSEKKKKIGEEIRRMIQNGRDIQRDTSTPRKTIRAKTVRVTQEEE